MMNRFKRNLIILETGFAIALILVFWQWSNMPLYDSYMPPSQELLTVGGTVLVVTILVAMLTTYVRYHVNTQSPVTLEESTHGEPKDDKA
jgi:hypothetical protein